MNSAFDWWFHTFAGFLTWGVVVGLSIMVLSDSPMLYEAIAWQVLILVLFVAATNDRFARLHPLALPVALAAMAVVTMFLSSQVKVDFLFIYTIIWVALIPSYFSARISWLLLIVVNVGWYFIRDWVWEDSNPFLETLLVGTFHVFALMSALAARKAEAANEKTQQLNRELLATQHLLAEASKEGERTRISRDLHDLLGHHLTALTINLQVAERLSDGEAKERITQCHSLSKLLLADVREAVSVLRDTPLVGLKELLRLATQDTPKLEIEVNVHNDQPLQDITIAQVILRVTQEALTNSLKHSKATQFTIEAEVTQSIITLLISDNGVGNKSLTVGNGLIGMRERIESSGGSLKIQSQPNFQLSVELPYEGKMP